MLCIDNRFFFKALTFSFVFWIGQLQPALTFAWTPHKHVVKNAVEYVIVPVTSDITTVKTQQGKWDEKQIDSTDSKRRSWITSSICGTVSSFFVDKNICRNSNNNRNNEWYDNILFASEAAAETESLSGEREKDDLPQTAPTAVGGGIPSRIGMARYDPVVVTAETVTPNKDSSSSYPICESVQNGLSNKNVERCFIDGSFTLRTNLGRSRIGALELSPSTSRFGVFQPLELYYPSFLFGSWNVTSTLIQKSYPYGLLYVPSTGLIEGSPRSRNERVGRCMTSTSSCCSYEIRYFSTLPNTLSNQIAVNLGTAVPTSAILQDRAFNIKSISNAYNKGVCASTPTTATIENVIWDYRSDPTKVVLEYSAGQLSDDMRPLGNRRTDIYITARNSEYLPEGGGDIFASSEKYRSVTISAGNVVVSDTETTTEFQKMDDDTVFAVSRIAVYLTPNPNSREGILWQQVNGKAVAMFDYEFVMKRIKERFFTTASDDGSRTQTNLIERACVQTPNDIIQCQ